MPFLQRERDTLEDLLPGLDGKLATVGLTELEQPGGPGLKLFKDSRGPALLIPTEHGGLGVDPVRAVRVQRAIAARSPSLAVATTMHHFSVAGLVEATAVSEGLEWMLLQAVAEQNLLVASGFAEGRPGQAILSPTMTGEETAEGIRISGSKRPCSLSRSMDMLTASIAMPRPDGAGFQLCVALVPKHTPGMSVRPFWNSFVLAGAESDEVVLDRVVVRPDLVVRTKLGPDDTLDRLQTTGFVWFELLMTASYLGMASALVERAVAGERIAAATRAAMAIELEATMLSLEGVADTLRWNTCEQDALAATLICRYAAQDAIARASRAAVEALGGMAHIESHDVAYLAACTACLAFHPPSRASMAAPMCDWFAGSPLRIA